jgi:hypothetical protein
MTYRNNHLSADSTKDVAALVAAYRKSGLGLRRFAREHKIPVGRLHYWVYQKHRSRRPKSLSQARISDPPPVFHEVKLGVGSALMENWVAEVRLAGGLSVRLSRTATPDWIGELIHALQRPC